MLPEWMVAVVVATVPFVVVFALLAWAGRRQALRRDAVAQQIALIDRIHARLGAVAAPVVRRRRGGWQVRIAVPFERPAVTQILLAIVREILAPPDGPRRSLEIIVTRQADTKPVGAGAVRWESVSCT
jgi:hypothetical protein